MMNIFIYTGFKGERLFRRNYTAKKINPLDTNKEVTTIKWRAEPRDSLSFRKVIKREGHPQTGSAWFEKARSVQ